MASNDLPDHNPERGWDMSAADQATVVNWLQARYLEVVRELNVVRKYDKTGEVPVGPDDRKSAVVPLARYHQFLEAKQLPVAMTVQHCLTLNWIQEIQRIGPGNYTQWFYRIMSSVMQVVVERPKQVEAKPTIDTALVHDGPCPPDSFRWQGRSAELGPKSWGVVNYLWTQQNRSAHLDSVSLAVWQDEELGGRGIQGVRYRTNRDFLKLNIPFELRIANSHVQLAYIGPVVAS